MDITLAILCISVLIYPLHYLIQAYLKRRKIAEAIEPLGGEKCYPFIGTTLGIMKAKREGLFDYVTERNKTYGPIYRTYGGSVPAVHIIKAQDIEKVLKSNSNNLAKGYIYRFVSPWLGSGLITGSGPKWRRNRKLLTPTFHFSVLDNLTEVFSSQAKILVDQLSAKANGEFFDVYPLLTNCALTIICKAAMGVDINDATSSNSEYVQAISGIVDLIVHRTFHPYLYSDIVWYNTSKGRLQQKYLEILHGFTRQVIQKRKEKLMNGNAVEEKLTEEDILLGKKRRLVFLDLLLEANRDKQILTDEEIREEVDTFMFAGHDTSTATVALTLFALANFPDAQEKVFEELDDIFNGEERPVTPQDTTQMQYLERVIKETLRLIGVVPAIVRSLDTPVEIRGHTIPVGVQVVMHLCALHKDPEQFPDPERFDPDRFLPERSVGRHPYAFIPFSAGPRNCLGQKFAMRNNKVMLASILRKFRVQSSKKLHEVKYYSEVVLRPIGGLPISFEPRNTGDYHNLKTRSI